MFASKFLKDESGAVTVDWVVLTAAIVGIAIAVLTLIAAGINTSSNTTSERLSSGTDVASLIGGSSGYGTWQDYMSGNGDDPDLALAAAAADAPEGFETSNYYDEATGAPVYYQNNSDPSSGGYTYSIAGEEMTDSEFFGNGGSTTHYAS